MGVLFSPWTWVTHCCKNCNPLKNCTEFGLYASFMGAAVYGLTGSSRDVAVGPTALMALVVGEAFPELPGPAGNTTWECADPARDLAECCTSGGELLCTSVPKVIASSLVAGAFLTVLGMLNLGVVSH